MRSGLQTLGTFLNDCVRRWLPDSFVFALGLTLLVGLASLIWTTASPFETLRAWYDGFWTLLEFGMQMVLILATGYAIALSPAGKRLVDAVAQRANTPTKVYATVVVVGGLLSLVSWGWVVLTAVLGRELAERVRGVDYAFLTACVYVSGQPWVGGLSSSIPLLLATENNFMVEQGLMASTIPIQTTLGSWMNFAFLLMFFLVVPALMVALQPRTSQALGLSAWTHSGDAVSASGQSVAEEAAAERRPSFSDRLNHAWWLSLAVFAIGALYIAFHFATHGFDLNLNLMVFVFVMVGLLAHWTPMRYVVAMKRACSNISGIVLQYPFYAGIMGMMIFTGLGSQIAGWLARVSGLGSLPFLAQVAGASVNFAIPSAGGEWAVIGPSFVDSVARLTTSMPQEQVHEHLARVALAAAYGETSTNLIQPFFFLVILPIMGAGVRIQARDVIGHLVLPFAAIFVLTSIIVTWVPM